MKKRSLATLFIAITALAISYSCAEVAAPADTLLDKGGWVRRDISAGVVLFNYTGYSAICQSNQCVNVLQVSLDQNKLELVNSEELDSLSSFVGVREDAVAAINGSYFDEGTTYIRINQEPLLDVTVEPTDVRFWKHKAALYIDEAGHDIKIASGTIEEYRKSECATIASSAPLLIDNYKPIGADFVPEISAEEIKTLHYEDYRRHQGSRHPRTAIAMTDDNTVLLITVDGRLAPNAGMTAKELTLFIDHYFKPLTALNIDGGGSTTMYVKGAGTYDTNIVNYPTDNKRYDHYGQRKIKNALVVTPMK